MVIAITVRELENSSGEKGKSLNWKDTKDLDSQQEK